MSILRRNIGVVDSTSIIDEILMDLEEKKKAIQNKEATPTVYQTIEEVLRRALGPDQTKVIHSNFERYNIDGWSDFYKKSQLEDYPGIPEIRGNILGKIDVLISAVKSQETEKSEKK